MLHSLTRPVYLLSAAALLIGASVLGSTVSAAPSMIRGELSGQPSTGNQALEQNRGQPQSNAPWLSAQPSELTEGTWRLDSYSSNGFLTPVLDNTPVTATFGRDGTISGDASCNTYSGSYHASEFSIAIGPLLTTRMTCDRDVMEQEHAFLEAVESAATFTIQATTLTLAEAGGLPVAIFGKGLLSTAVPSS